MAHRTVAGPIARLVLARSEHVLVECVPAPPALVRAFYSDLDALRAVHPLIESVHLLRQRQGAAGVERTHRVRDRIPFGPVTLPVVYTARVTVPAAGDLVTAARQFPGIRLDGVVSFEAADGGNRLTERLGVTAPRPLAGATERRAIAAHAAMLAGIRAHFG